MKLLDYSIIRLLDNNKSLKYFHKNSFVDTWLDRLCNFP